MQQCSAPHATKAAPPSSRINSLESLCGTLRFYGIFLWDIKSLLTCWHGAQQLSHAQGFSLGTFLVSLHVQAHRVTQPPAQQGWDIPVPNASESSNTRHVWWGECTGFSITGKEGLPAHLQLHLPSHVAWAVFPLKSCDSTDPGLRSRAKAILGWTWPAQRAEGNTVVPRTWNVRFKILLEGQAGGKDNILKHKTTISTFVLQLLKYKAKPWSSASQYFYYCIKAHDKNKKLKGQTRCWD